MNDADAELRAKIDCLSRPETFPEHPLAVEAIETHFAWVFLAGRYAYKLKKPLRFHDFDLTMLATRRANCELEVALNRRLAPAVYVGTVPLTAHGAQLSLGGAGTPVEWLVKMHRLPRERSLDRLAAAGELDDEQLHSVLERLARFYAAAPRAPWDGRAYRGVLAHEIERTQAELTDPALGLPTQDVALVAAELRQRLAADASLFHARVAAERVVDTHGDLRPEHIFLTPELQIIDCLEFSAELRLQDSAAEIAFLTLECDRLGYAPLGKRILELYRQYARDDVGSELLAFHRAARAFVRAKIAAWHLSEPFGPGAHQLWRERTHWYLAAAATSLGRQTAAR